MSTKMAENVSPSRNELMDGIRLKVNSLTALLSEMRRPGNDCEFDPSICDDVHAYVNIVRTDCQKIVDADRLGGTFSDADGGSNVPGPIRRVYANDRYDDEMRRFENEIDSEIDRVIRSVETNAGVLSTCYAERTSLDELADSTYGELRLHKTELNGEIDRLNSAGAQTADEFHELKGRLKRNNDANIALLDQARRLIREYQQHATMVRNNVTNSVESAAKSFALRAECLKLETRIAWEGKTILKMYKNIDKLVEVNQRKLDRYDDLQSETGNVNSAIDKDLDYMTRTNAKLRDQIQIHSDVGRIAEDKHRRLCLLNDEIREIQELLVNDREYLNSVELKTKENETEIAVKRQQIEDELIEAKRLKDELESKNKLVSDAQRSIEQKQSRLEEIESRNEKTTRELENARSEQRKKRYNAELMQRIMDHHERETREKIQYYCDGVIRPLELKLEESIASMDRETTRNDDESTTASATWSDAEFRAVADDFGSRTERLDETLAAQRETTGKLADELRAIQTDVVRELNVSADRGEQYMDAFRTVADYNAKMASNAEAKRTAARLECELFQKRYETTRRGEKLVDEEQRLASRSRELKRSVRRQAAYNKELSRRYVRLTESQQHG